MSNGVSPYTLTPPLPVLFPSQLEEGWLHQRPGQTGHQRCRGQRRQHRILERSRVPPDACAPSSCDGDTGRGGLGVHAVYGEKTDRQNYLQGTWADTQKFAASCVVPCVEGGGMGGTGRAARRARNVTRKGRAVLFHVFVATLITVRIYGLWCRGCIEATHAEFFCGCLEGGGEETTDQ